MNSELIILYGESSNQKNHKQQLMIDSDVTCMYREYAKNYGHIIYLSPQNIKHDWEHVILDPNHVLEFINKYPNAIIWSVKNSKKKDKFILSKIPKYRKTMYYSCCANNSINNHVKISLVDTPERIKGNAKLWFKGKDEKFWKYDKNIKKEFDYVLCGLRGDKHETYFINHLTNNVKDKRSVMWIGGLSHKSKILPTHHNIQFTDKIGPDKIKELYPLGKIGILFTSLTVEGHPQTSLEMTISGLPIVYNVGAPRNIFYFKEGVNCVLSNKKDLIRNAEKLLKNYSEEMSQKCRDFAVEHYSLDKSFEFIKSLFD